MIDVCGDFIQNRFWGIVYRRREGVWSTLFDHCMSGNWNIQHIALACRVCINISIIGKQAADITWQCTFHW